MHLYGALNMVVPIDRGAQLTGPNGWCGGGWTAPAPGSYQYPEVKNGAPVAPCYLPAGRNLYDIKAPADGCPRRRDNHGEGGILPLMSLLGGGSGRRVGT
jgi:hypothetical protein